MGWRREIGPDVVAAPDEAGQHPLGPRAPVIAWRLGNPIDAGGDVLQMREPQALLPTDLQLDDAVADHRRLAGRVDPGLECRGLGHREVDRESQRHGNGETKATV